MHADSWQLFISVLKLSKSYRCNLNIIFFYISELKQEISENENVLSLLFRTFKLDILDVKVKAFCFVCVVICNVNDLSSWNYLSEWCFLRSLTSVGFSISDASMGQGQQTWIFIELHRNWKWYWIGRRSSGRTSKFRK